jgi:hypothetical protein
MPSGRHCSAFITYESRVPRAPSRRKLSTVVHTSGCVSPFLYVLLYGVDMQVSGQLGQTPARSVLSTGAGLFVPKPSTGGYYQRRNTRGLRQTVRGRPLASTAVGGDCHSLRHSVAAESVVSSSCPHTLSKSARLGSAEFRAVCCLRRLCQAGRAERPGT